MPKTRTQPIAPPAIRRVAWTLGVAAVSAALLVPGGAQAARSSGAAKIARKTLVVKLLAVKSVSAKPVFGSRSLSAVADQRPITLTTTTLPVLGTTTDGDGRVWLRVRLPGRVFHRKTPPPTGWITASNTRLSTTAWHVVVNVRTRRVIVYRDGRVLRTFGAIVGKSSTPTPRGEYFVEEDMHLSRRFPGAPFALATSARSPVLQEFMGGPGQIALHGLNNVGGTLGTAVSHGCVRVSTQAITWLAGHIEAGVPLSIV